MRGGKGPAWSVDSGEEELGVSTTFARVRCRIGGLIREGELGVTSCLWPQTFGMALTCAGLMVLRGMKETRPCLYCTSSSLQRMATSSLSTTTWKSWLPAGGRGRGKEGGGGHFERG